MDVAARIRAAQEKEDAKGPFPEYSVAETESELRDIMASLGIENYRIHIPKPPGGDGINYGMWIDIRKEEPETSG